jgi:ribosome-associated toxin RatA of RatAB toxin-antitoxin module
MSDIQVDRTDVERMLSRFTVRIREENSESVHDVTLSASDFERLGGGYRSPEELIRACIEFLLEREPKEQILSSFDVSVITTYFPEFEDRISASQPP